MLQSLPPELTIAIASNLESKEARKYQDNGKWPEALHGALITAAYYGNIGVFSLLLSLGSDISLSIGPNTAADTPSLLCITTREGISPKLKPRTLLEPESERPDLLGYLVKIRRAGVISCVLQGSNIDPNQPFIDSTWGISAAAWCVFENDPKTLAPFMRPGVRERVDFTLPNGDKERFPFSPASAEFGGIETFKMLATVASFKINAQNEDGYTALHWAVRYGDLQMVAFLITGADPMGGWREINRYLKSKPMCSEIEKAVHELRREPLDIDRVDGQGKTALHFAVQRREYADGTRSTRDVIAIIIMLLQYGAHPEIGWEDGQYNGPAITPLAQAIINRDGGLSVINRLLDTSKVSLELAKKQLPRDILSARKALLDQLEH